jgi:hypothetical protein
MGTEAETSPAASSRFEQLLEFAPDAIVGVDEDGAIRLANAQAQSLFGHAHAELLGKPVEMLIPARFRGGHGRHRDGYFAEPRTRPMGADLDLFGLRKDGSEFPAEISLSSIASGAAVIALVAIRDITDRREAEQASAYLAAIVNSSDDAIVGKGLDGAIVSWNAGAERLYGYRSDEAIGAPVSLIMPEGLVDGMPESVATIATDGRVERYEGMRVRKDGSVVAVSLTQSPIRDGRGRVIGAATIGHDITAARAAQRKFDQLLEFAPDAMVGVGRDGRIMLANARTEELFGWQREELLGRALETLIPARLRHGHSANRDTYLDDPRTRPMGADLELFGLRRDGTEFPAEISLSSMETEDGQVAIAAIRDITDRELLRKELDDERRHKAKREKADLEAQLNQLRRLESVGQLAGGIAHDFNNLLGVILNYAQFVGDEIGDESPAFEDVEEIRRAAERAASLTRQLLIFSRREVVQKQVLDLNALVSDLDRLLRRVLGEHIELETRFASDLGPVEADPGQLEQVLVNLAVNARDAMPTGGSLLIETQSVEIDEGFGDVTPGPYMRLSVADTGAGMDAETVRRAFEPFFTTKPKGEGTGLGLATVYGIVAEAGGVVRIASEPGIGTTVKVHLPASSSAPHEEAADTGGTQQNAVGGQTVLVVEDEDSVRRLADRILRSAGYRVVVASNGADALATLQQEADGIDLLLTDVVMPGMLGPELVERATAMRPQLKVVYMSGYIPQVSARLGMTTPLDRPFVEKPFTSKTLLTTLSDALAEAASP